MVVSLVAALMLLTFVSAAGVSERQPGFGSDNPKVISCARMSSPICTLKKTPSSSFIESRILTLFRFAESDVCVQAASFWRDCQTAQPNFLVAEPGAGTRQCLCNPQTATPDHAEDWWKKLNACVQCVEEPLGDDIGSSSGALDGLRQDFCNRVFSKGHFIQHAQHLQQASEFPLRLPEAILSNSNAAKGAARRAGDGAYLPGTQAFSQIAHVYTTPSITTAMVTQTVVPIKCNHDNCLRSFMRAGSPAISFCSEYTTNSALTSSSYRLPDYAMSCWGNNYSRISSACTCLNEIATETSTSAKTTDGITTPKSSTPTSAGYTKQTQSSGKSFSISSTSTADSYGQEPSSSDKSTSMTSTPTLNPSAHYTRTTTITSWTTIYSTSTGSSTPTSFHNITSTTSPLTKTETPSSSYTDHVNTTSYTAKASSYTTSGTSSTTTPAATKGSSGGWITLPASDAMVKCSSETTPAKDAAL